MKVLLVVALILGAALAAPKRETHFRNLFKKAVGAQKHAPSGRIINGEVAEPHSIPYQALLEVHDGAGSAWYCGGSLIKEDVVLTAAYCGYQGNQVVVTLGAQTPLNPEDSQVKVISKDIVVHENYSPNFEPNDIALVRLPAPVTLTDAIQLAVLPADDSNTYEGLIGRVSGWGVTDGWSDSLSKELRYTEDEIMSNQLCQAFFLGGVSETHVCLSGANAHGICYGDTGGPLTVDGVQIGVVSSYGHLLCYEGYPSVFTRLSKYLDWIETNSSA